MNQTNLRYMSLNLFKAGPPPEFEPGQIQFFLTGCFLQKGIACIIEKNVFETFMNWQKRASNFYTVAEMYFSSTTIIAEKMSHAL